MKDRKTIPQLILALLSDMKPHPVREVHSLLGDELGSQKNIHPHLSKVRNMIPENQEVICQQIGMIRYYRLIYSFKNKKEDTMA